MMPSDHRDASSAVGRREGAAGRPDDGSARDDDTDECLRLELQSVQSEVERRRRAPVTRLALVIDRALGAPRLRQQDPARSAPSPVAGSGGTMSGPPLSVASAVAAGRRQLDLDLAREREALERLTSRLLPRTAAVLDRHLPSPPAARRRRPRGDGVGSGRAAGVMVVSTATPPGRGGRAWGDAHLAADLAAALGRSGIQVTVRLAGPAAPEVPPGATHLVVRGLRRIPRAVGTRHVVWVISHPEQVTTAECDEADLVLVASAPFAEHLRGRTSTPVAVVEQATDPDRFRPVATAGARYELLVVANTRGVMRPAIAAALEAGLRPAIVGAGWRGLVPDSLIVADRVPNHDLAGLYGRADLVLADHWTTMRTWGFAGNRLFDVLACGTPLVSDDVVGLDALLEGTVPTWRDPTELLRLVADRRAHPERWVARALAGRALVLERHTMNHRAAQIQALVDGLGDLDRS